MSYRIGFGTDSTLYRYHGHRDCLSLIGHMTRVIEREGSYPAWCNPKIPTNILYPQDDDHSPIQGTYSRRGFKIPAPGIPPHYRARENMEKAAQSTPGTK